MKQSGRVPCPAWATKLAATHPTDLPPAEHAALDAHIANCPACASIQQSYRDIEVSLLALPPIEPCALHPEQLPARRRAEERHLAPFEKKRRNLKLVAPPAAIHHQPVPH